MRDEKMRHAYAGFNVSKDDAKITINIEMPITFCIYAKKEGSSSQEVGYQKIDGNLLMAIETDVFNSRSAYNTIQQIFWDINDLVFEKDFESVQSFIDEYQSLLLEHGVHFSYKLN